MRIPDPVIGLVIDALDAQWVDTPKDIRPLHQEHRQAPIEEVIGALPLLERAYAAEPLGAC